MSPESQGSSFTLSSLSSRNKDSVKTLLTLYLMLLTIITTSARPSDTMTTSVGPSMTMSL